MTIREAIQQRISVRTYQPADPDFETIANIQDILTQSIIAPFSGKPRFQLIRQNLGENIKIGTYGFIRDAQYFIAGAIHRDRFAEVDFGFVFEKIILDLTALGLGTCWLGGTFSRGDFAKLLNLKNDEIIPCVSPVGLPAENKRLAEKLLRRAVGADNRKRWDELFFQDHMDAPLPRENAGDYEVVLELLRLAPSASNKQPWRIIRHNEAYHFFLKRTAGYARHFSSVDLQLVDIGIAMCHWLLMAKELDLEGYWHRFDTGPDLPKKVPLDYVVSWMV